MTTSIFPFRLTISLVALLDLAAIGCHGGEEAKGAEATEVPLVKVAKPIVTDVPIVLPYTANIQAIFQAKIVPEFVSGYLTSVNIEDGQFVRKGDLLAAIEKSPYVQQLQEADEKLAQAQAEVRNNKLLVQRYGQMLKAKLIAQQDFDNQETALEVAQARLKRAEDALQLSRVYLGYCDIRAPFTGYATNRLLDPGQYVSPQGPPIAVVMKLDTLRVFIDVVEHDIPLVKIGQDVAIHVDAYPTRTFHGKVTYIAQAVQPETRTMRLEADIPNVEEALRPGMYARVGIVVGNEKNAIVIPDLALAVSNQGAAVFPVRNGKMERQPVELGYDMGGFIVVKGLDANEELVIAGRDLAKLGEPVKSVPSELAYHADESMR
ncbi:MAG: efflux RND transporter periplasmic adaptor subunit [Deltaproteobacteria bacterium]